MVVYIVWENMGECRECGVGYQIVEVCLMEETAKARVWELFKSQSNPYGVENMQSHYWYEEWHVGQ